MTAVTIPEMRLKNNPWASRIVKITRVNGWINWTYAKSVNHQRIRESKPADFVAAERSWGVRRKQTPVVEYNDELYLEVKVQARDVVFRDIETLAIVPLAVIKRFLRPTRPSRRQHLHRDVILRDYRVDHIAELRIAGEVWRIRKCWNRLQKLNKEQLA